MSGVTPQRWLGQWPNVIQHIDQIDNLEQRGHAITELLDTIWNKLIPELGQHRRVVVRNLAARGMNDGQIATAIGVNRQRVSQLRRM